MLALRTSGAAYFSTLASPPEVLRPAQVALLFGGGGAHFPSWPPRLVCEHPFHFVLERINRSSSVLPPFGRALRITTCAPQWLIEFLLLKRDWLAASSQPAAKRPSKAGPAAPAAAAARVAAAAAQAAWNAVSRYGAAAAAAAASELLLTVRTATVLYSTVAERPQPCPLRNSQGLLLPRNRPSFAAAAAKATGAAGTLATAAAAAAAIFLHWPAGRNLIALRFRLASKRLLEMTKRRRRTRAESALKLDS